MIKYFVRFIFFGVACFFDIFAILKLCEQWFEIKFFNEISVAIGIIIGVLTIIAAIVFLKRPLTAFEKAAKILQITTMLLFFAGSISVQLKILDLNIERGTYLYDKYSDPVMIFFFRGFFSAFLNFGKQIEIIGFCIDRFCDIGVTL